MAPVVWLRRVSVDSRRIYSAMSPRVRLLGALAGACHSSSIVIWVHTIFVSPSNAASPMARRTGRYSYT